MKKTILALGALLLSTTALGAEDISQQTEDVTVLINIISPITLTLSDSALIDFGDVLNTQTEERSALNDVTMSVAGASNGAKIDFYIHDKNDNDKDTGEEIVLAHTDNSTLTSILKLSSLQQTAGSSGTVSSKISATIAAGQITTDTSSGQFSGTIAVYAEYN